MQITNCMPYSVKQNVRAHIELFGLIIRVGASTCDPCSLHELK